MRANNILGEHNANAKENVRPKNSKAVGSKRSALGCVTNQVRVQPVRAAKDKHTVLTSFVKQGQENAAPGVQKKASGFAIFQDSAPVQKVSSRVPTIYHEPMCDQENLDLELNDALSGLHRESSLRSLHPLGPLSINVDPLSASPMAIDSPTEDKESQSRDEYGLDPYYEDIYDYLRLRETTARPGTNYMTRQTDVTTSMRNILVDWLVEVGEEYKLHRETLFLAIGYIDKFLSLVGVQRPKLQLVGTASMFIAAKYEEIYPPDVAEFVYITDDTYTRNQVLKMESVILKLLEFKVAMPTINWFTERFMDALDMSEKAKSLAFMFTELSLIEVEGFLQYQPSMIAASAVVLARLTVADSEYLPSTLCEVSKYSLSDMRACIRSLHQMHHQSKVLAQQAVNDKYKQPKYHSVSQIAPLPVLNLD